MSRLKQLVWQEGREAYTNLFVAFVGVVLMWAVQFALLIQLNIGDHVNVNWLVFLNIFTNGFLLFMAVAILFGLTAFALIHSWRQALIVVMLTAFIGFCGLLAFAVGTGDTFSYDVSASTRYADQGFKILHAYHNGDMIAAADYLLLHCDLSGSDCQVTERFQDYHCCGANQSKPVRFYVQPSDKALYLKVGDETHLVTKL